MATATLRAASLMNFAQRIVPHAAPNRTHEVKLAGVAAASMVHRVAVEAGRVNLDADPAVNMVPAVSTGQGVQGAATSKDLRVALAASAVNSEAAPAVDQDIMVLHHTCVAVSGVSFVKARRHDCAVAKAHAVPEAVAVDLEAARTSDKAPAILIGVLHDRTSISLTRMATARFRSRSSMTFVHLAALAVR